MNERPGRKALFVGVSPKAGEEGDRRAGRLEEDLAVMTSWVETALSGNTPDAAEDDIGEPVLHPLVSQLIELISRAGEDNAARREQERLFMEHPLPMALRDNKLSIITVNQAYKALFSGATDWMTSPGRSSGQAVIHGEEPADSVFITGKPEISEVVMEQSDGTKKFFRQHAIPYRFSGETVVLALFSYLDITDLRVPQSEAQKEQLANAGSGTLSSGLYQNNPTPMLILDSRFKIREANQAFITETGLSRETLDGKRIDDLPFIPEEDNERGMIIQAGSTSPRRIYLNCPDGQRGYDLTAFSLGDTESPARYIVQLYNVSGYLDSIRDLSLKLERVTRDQSGSGGDSGREERNENDITVPKPAVAGTVSREMTSQPQSSDSVEGPRESRSAPLLRGEEETEQETMLPASVIQRDSPGESIPAEVIPVDPATQAGLQQYAEPRVSQEIRDSPSGQEKNREQDNEGSDGKSYGIVEFGLGGSHYALDITITREIVEMMPITSLPHAPAYLKGVMNLRGEIFNIIDVQKILGVGERKSDSSGKIIVLTSDATDGENIGIIVDDVQSVRQIHENAIEYMNDSKDFQRAGLMKGIIKVTTEGNGEKKGEKHLIIWLDVQELVMDLIRQNMPKKANI